jgi:hypothetical protein
MDRQSAWSIYRVVYGRAGAISLYERKAADPRQDRAWEAVKKSTGSHGAHFPGDQKCIPHPRGLLCGRLIAKIFRPVAGVFATADFFTASGAALQACQEIMDCGSEIARHVKIVLRIQVGDHKRKVLRRLESGDFIALGQTLVYRHA